MGAAVRFSKKSLFTNSTGMFVFFVRAFYFMLIIIINVIEGPQAFYTFVARSINSIFGKHFFIFYFYCNICIVLYYIYIYSNYSNNYSNPINRPFVNEY